MVKIKRTMGDDIIFPKRYDVNEERIRNVQIELSFSELETSERNAHVPHTN
jgi:hypothetical protein